MLTCGLRDVKPAGVDRVPADDTINRILLPAVVAEPSDVTIDVTPLVVPLFFWTWATGSRRHRQLDHAVGRIEIDRERFGISQGDAAAVIVIADDLVGGAAVVNDGVTERSDAGCRGCEYAVGDHQLEDVG